MTMTKWIVKCVSCGSDTRVFDHQKNDWFILDDLFAIFCRCVVAFASDLIFLGTSLNPHRRKGLKTYSVSLDHA